MLQRAIVVGGSSGMGAALAEKLVSNGYVVALVARNVEKLQGVANRLNGENDPRVWVFPHDVLELENVESCFHNILTVLGGLDLCVYAAGVMPEVGPATYDAAVDNDIIRVNVIGAMAWLNMAAGRFMLQGSGTIVGLGSVAGDRGRRGNPAYCASKAALHTYLEALRNRLSVSGVRVLTIKPGPVRTPMTEGKDNLPMIIEADVAAEKIWRCIRGGWLDTVYVSFQWRWIMAIIRAIPSRVFRRTNI